jgi:hypothetical protein
MECETSVICPWCGEQFALMIDTSQGDHELIEDCTICCRPIQFVIVCEPGEVTEINASRS